MQWRPQGAFSFCFISIHSISFSFSFSLFSLSTMQGTCILLQLTWHLTSAIEQPGATKPHLTVSLSYVWAQQPCAKQGHSFTCKLFSCMGLKLGPHWEGFKVAALLCISSFGCSGPCGGPSLCPASPGKDLAQVTLGPQGHPPNAMSTTLSQPAPQLHWG